MFKLSSSRPCEQVVLIEFLVKILRERAVIFRKCFLFYYNSRKDRKSSSFSLTFCK